MRLSVSSLFSKYSRFKGLQEIVILNFLISKIKRNACSFFIDIKPSNENMHKISPIHRPKFLPRQENTEKTWALFSLMHPRRLELVEGAHLTSRI